MKIFRVGASALFAVALGSVCLAASPVGKWKGKVGGSMPPLPANANAQQKQQYDAAKAMVAKIVINLELKSNNTYSVTVDGGPQKAPAETGSWSAKGNTITVTSTKGGQKRSQSMTLSADGSKLTMSPQGSAGTKVTFVRA